MSLATVWVLGDQLNRRIASLAERDPGEVRVLMIESEAKMTAKRWHRQRAHTVLASMRRFATELRDAGFTVDYRRAARFADGVREHRSEHAPDRVEAMEPMSLDGRQMLDDLGIEVVRSNQFLCHYDDFAAWAGGRSSLRMEDFYRWQRGRLDVLMDGEGPVGGRWNFDASNRERPPLDGRSWPQPPRSELDEIDREVLDALPAALPGADPDGTWPTTRRRALLRLRHAVEHTLPRFGPHQDAMLRGQWLMAHTGLSVAMNLGLLHPSELVEAAEEAYRAGDVPLASAEGFIRQVLGWREYVWGVYWLWGSDYRRRNALGAELPLPTAFSEPDRTEMACVGDAARSVETHAYAHHIQRLMVFGNLALTAGVRPQALVDWMWRSFVDGAEWVMLPNVIGMATYADGGRMMTKPYASGGAYINRMSDYCADCRYDPGARTGEDACPFTTLYWDFLRRHRRTFAGNRRLARPLANLDRLGDLDEIAARATVVRRGLREGTV